MNENRFSMSSQEESTGFMEDRPPSRISRASTTSSRTTITREDVSLMSGDELDILCREIFSLCDANGDGFITQEELMVQCGNDDPDMLEQLMTSMDTNRDGKISFEEFRSGINSVSEQITRLGLHSTPETKQEKSIYHSEDSCTVFESEPSTCEKEEAWMTAMERIDPNGFISNNEELRSVWIDLLTQDSVLLERFEGFLSNVVEELDKSHSNVEQIEKRMKQVLSNHSREVYEMDGMLDEQLQEAYVKQQMKSQEASNRLNHQYRDLLADRDELIANLAKNEETLKNALQEKSQTEQELRRERLKLLNLNESLQDQLTDSYKQLESSQKRIKRLSYNFGEWTLPEEMTSGELSLPLSESLPISSRGDSLSPQHMPILSPPINQSLPLSSFPFTPPSLAIEVEEAMKQTDTPSRSVTPTDEHEREALLKQTIEHEEVGVVIPGSQKNSSYIPVSSGNSSEGLTEQTITSRTESPILNNMTPKSISDHNHKHYNHNSHPSSTPVNLTWESPFTVSTILPPRRDEMPKSLASFATPSRVFKVVIVGDSGVGKTCLIHRLSSGVFTNPHSTLGLDYTTSVVSVGDEKVIFQLWDTAGQERFQSTTAVYFKRADAFIIVYDVTNKLSFKSIKSWISLIKATLRNELPVLMIMGNKSDKEIERKVTKEEGRLLALELQALFSEASALSGDNVIQSHTTLASLLLERENQDMEAIKRSALRLDKVQQQKKCKC